MLIQNFGLHWLRDKVLWRCSSENGQIWGVPAVAKRQQQVNFRDQIGVYALYRDFEMIYVGRAGAEAHSLFRRLRAHTRNRLADRWDRFSWFGLRGVAPDGTLVPYPAERTISAQDALDHIEAVLIAAAEPRLNRRAGVFSRGAGQYIQRPDPRLGPPTDEMVKELLKSLRDEEG